MQIDIKISFLCVAHFLCHLFTKIDIQHKVLAGDFRKGLMLFSASVVEDSLVVIHNRKHGDVLTGMTKKLKNRVRDRIA